MQYLEIRLALEVQDSQKDTVIGGQARRDSKMNGIIKYP